MGKATLQETEEMEWVGTSLPWQDERTVRYASIRSLEDLRPPSAFALFKMRILGAIRAYFNRSPIPMPTVFLAAGLLSVLFVFTSFIGRTHMGTDPTLFDWWMQAPIPFLNFFTWTLLLPAVSGWSQRWPLKGRPMWRPILVHIGLGLVLCAVHEVFNSTLYLLILHNSGRIVWQPEMLSGALLSLPGGIAQRFMEYWVLLVLLLYMETHRQVREERTRVLQLQNELQTTQLLALKKQLQPHFLFNTLNTVSALMDVDIKSARTVLSRLGQLLRITLDEERRETVRLIHEVDHVGNYLDIEAIRFKDRLQVRYDIPAECQNALVPSMVLQPLVENSIKHGLDATSEEVCITIEALRHNGDLMLKVSDNGKGCPDMHAALTRGGIGLRNVRERLSLLHGPKGGFQALSEPGKGFHVVISFPFETKERPRHEEHPHHRGR
ncbi:MAG TPA: histidine kinase [Flavobacteriales bacterium]